MSTNGASLLLGYEKKLAITKYVVDNRIQLRVHASALEISIAAVCTPQAVKLTKECTRQQCGAVRELSGLRYGTREGETCLPATMTLT